MTEESNLQIEVRAGEASPKTVALSANEPVQPFTVGRKGTWQVLADGVADIHAYLFFDGVTLFVSNVDAQNPAYADGAPLAAQWTALRPGSTIHLGEAMLSVRGDSDEALDPDSIPTQYAIRPKRPAPAPSEPSEDEPTIVFSMPPGDESPQAPRPAAGRSALEDSKSVKKKKLKIRQSAREIPTDDDDATRFAPLDPNAHAILSAANHPNLIGGDGALPPSASMPSTAQATKASGFTPPGVQATPAMAPSLGATPPPDTAPMPSGSAPVPGGSAPVPGGPPDMPGGSAPVPGGPPDMPGGSAPVPDGPPANGTHRPASGTSEAKQTPVQAVLAQWKAASWVQKAILVLMPFAFVSVYIVFKDASASRAPRSKSSAAPALASTPGTASATGPEPSAGTPSIGPLASGDAGAVPATIDAAIDAQPLPTLAKGKKTKQREAADALAGGNPKEALPLYEELAKQHPDNQAYADVVRILRQQIKSK